MVGVFHNLAGGEGHQGSFVQAEDMDDALGQLVGVGTDLADLVNLATAYEGDNAEAAAGAEVAGGSGGTAGDAVAAAGGGGAAVAGAVAGYIH